ncbi:DNA polymerase [Aphelenchoides besseyi]|nr:DNA polymerase [Aphelenchoides besseyi]
MSKNVDWRKYERVPSPHFDTNVPLALQFLDVDYVTVSDGVRFRIFGTTRNGNSVCCSIRDYTPYFYVQTPESYRAENVSTYIKEINAEVKRKSLFYRYGDVGIVCRIEEIHGANIMGYNEKMDDRFLKIYIRFPSLMILCQQAIETIFCNGNLQFYETNVDVELRFMIDNRMVGCGWIECKANSYTLNTTTEPETTCQIEITTTIDGIEAHSPENDVWSSVAPLRILSFDIECSGRPNQFPEPHIDPIIQIACSCQTLGDDKSFARVCFVLNGCLPIDNVQIVDCTNEDQLLSEWARFIRAVDPDIITGYNIHAFDFVYITERLKCLRNESIRNYVLRTISRTSNSPCVVRDVHKTSKEKGSRTYKQVRINGRVVLDTYWAIRREHTLRSYTLNNVSYHFLGERKEDVEYKNITKMHQGTASDRRRLAAYCLKDAELPLKLLNHLMVIVNNVEMARVTGVPINLLITQGQQIRIVFQLLRKAKSLNYLFPAIKRSGEDDVPCEGGLVFEPRRGYYCRPIVTLDFASLYPTIMIAYNLCYTTLIHQLPDELCTIFCRHENKQKKELSETSDPLRKMVLNGRQLALKISANSIYGFTGATSGKLYNRELCQAITSFGRCILERTKELIETNTESESYSHRNFCVLYGDTDSVMVDFEVANVEAAIEVGKEMAQFISSNCKRPIELKFEKVYFPYLLIQKKRYAGVCYTSCSDVPDKIETKGLETIRRDNCPLVGNVMSHCMDLMLLQRNPEEAVSYAKKIISDLNQSKIDISQLIISKELRKTNSQYRNDQPHASVAQLLQKRDPATAPQLGDRVPFVFVKRADKTLAADKAEDPGYVLANKLPIDYDYYFRHQLLNPLVRLLNPVTNEKAEMILTTGKHARKHLTPISKTVGIGSYMKDVHTCFNCKRKVYGFPAPPLCKKCTSEFDEVYTTKMFELRDTQQRFARLWSECQNCVKNFTSEVQCTAKDCQIFYAREKVRYDLEEVTETIRRFDVYEKEESKIDVVMIDDD